MRQVLINPDGSEQLTYTSDRMPVRALTDQLRFLRDFAAACHWHDDFEILVALDGEMDYFVNSKTVHLKKGEGIFVNARRLHYGFSARKQDLAYCFVVFHPNLLGSTDAVREELAAFTADSQPDYWLLGASSEEVMLFHSMYAAAEADQALQVIGDAAALISMLSRKQETASGEDLSQDWQLLRKMTGYIQAHYADRITLEQIAAAGAVCRSRCCALFKERLGATPVEYMTRYRLDKACDLLRQGVSITEAAYACGFHGSSYFAEVFRRVYHKTPRDYIREYRAEVLPK